MQNRVQSIHLPTMDQAIMISQKWYKVKYFCQKNLQWLTLQHERSLGRLNTIFRLAITSFHHLMKTGNGQSKYCINGPNFAHVVRSVIASFFVKNILLCIISDWSRSSDPSLVSVLIVCGFAQVLNQTMEYIISVI